MTVEELLHQAVVVTVCFLAGWGAGDLRKVIRKEWAARRRKADHWKDPL